MTYPISKDALDDRLAIVGTAGSGKTYAALGACEHLLARNSRLIFVDPLGVAWGLRLCEDGKAPSPFHPVIFGGSHGDLPITEHVGALIGETVATMSESCIIDLSQIGTKAGERRFMLAFLTALYRCTNKEPVHLIVDEADMFAPQKLLDKDGDAAKLLGMMETVVRRGRARGFIPWLITQRPAVLSKDVLSQADGVVALKLTAVQDRKAIGGWVESTADQGQWKTIDSALPTKQRGEAILWIPGRGILREVQFPPKTTYDSSRTPKRGEKQRTTELKPIDLGALKDKLGKVEAETKANDRRTLMAEIAKLKAAALAMPKPSLTVEKINRPDHKALEIAQKEGFGEGYAQGWTEGDRDGFARGAAAALDQGFGAVRDALKAFVGVQFVTGKPPKRVPSAPVQSAATVAPAPVRRSVPSPVQMNGSTEGLTVPQSRIMASLAFWKSIDHEAPTREQVASVAGYRPGSGNFNNLIGSLSSLGKTTVPQPGRLSLNTEYTAPSYEEAQAKLWSIFENPQRRLVEASLAAVGDLARDELATNAGYAPGSGNFNNICGSLTTMDVLQRSGQGRLQISDWAREVLS